jgi:hypothetical protein
MKTEIATTENQRTNESYVARYQGSADPYASFANEAGSMIVGQLITCKKGLWGIGREEETSPKDALYLAIVPTMARGMVKWLGGAIVDAKMGLVKDGFLVPHRYSLGDLDESTWEKAPDGEPRDPWTQLYLFQLVELSPPHGTLTFSSGSYGAKLMAQELCRIYSEEGPANPECYPVVALSTKPRASKSYGKIIGPWLDVKGWATLEDVKAGRKSGRPKPTAPNLEKEIEQAVNAEPDHMPWAPTP